MRREFQLEIKAVMVIPDNGNEQLGKLLAKPPRFPSAADCRKSARCAHACRTRIACRSSRPLLQTEDNISLGVTHDWRGKIKSKKLFNYGQKKITSGIFQKKAQKGWLPREGRSQARPGAAVPSPALEALIYPIKNFHPWNEHSTPVQQPNS